MRIKNEKGWATIIVMLVISLIISGCQGESAEIADLGLNITAEKKIVEAFPNGSSPRLLPSPKFVGISEADGFLDDDELVLAVKRDDQQKIYPLKILLWHELVNDNISDVTIVVSYCPLCGSANIFEREIVENNRKVVLEFESSGMVMDTVPLMRDKGTGSLFVEMNGTAILGNLSGRAITLNKIDSSIVYYRDWRAKYPKTEVLSLDTGSNEPYGEDPYTPYYSNREIPLGVSYLDDRLHPKEPVVGLRIGDVAVAYPELDVRRRGVIIDDVAGVSVRIQSLEDGSVEIVKRETGEVIPKIRAFWYVWAAHNQGSTIYESVRYE